MNERDEEPLDTREILGWAEYCCWAALVMTPIIWWLQGPSVSTDQFVVRTALVVISAIGGISLRGIAIFRQSRMATPGGASPQSAVETSQTDPKG